MAFVLEPLIAGELGERTELDPGTHPPLVTAVEYVLDAPVPDDLIESFPVFLVAEDLAYRLKAAGLDGFTVAAALVTPSPEYVELHPGAPTRAYRWLQVSGGPAADCWLASDHRLCVSDRMMLVLETADLTNCGVERL
jgi:hypothetical protein